MKLLITLILIVQFTSAIAQTEQELFVCTDKKVGYQGYCLADGTVVVKPEFCTATMEEIDGYFIVSKAAHYYVNGKRKEKHIPDTEKFALLNKKGEFVLSFENNYQFIYVTNGIIAVQKNNLYGLVNNKNEILVPIDYDYLDVKNQEMIIANKKEKQGIIDINNRIVVPIIYDRVFNYVEVKSNNNFYVIVSKNNENGILDKNNKFILPLGKEDIQFITETSICIKKNNKFMLMDYSLNNILFNSFDEMQVHGFYEKTIYAKKGEYDYKFTTEGKLLTKSKTKLNIKKPN